jgi:hypothetical protein
MKFSSANILGIVYQNMNTITLVAYNKSVKEKYILKIITRTLKNHQATTKFTNLQKQIKINFIAERIWAINDNTLLLSNKNILYFYNTTTLKRIAKIKIALNVSPNTIKILKSGDIILMYKNTIYHIDHTAYKVTSKLTFENNLISRCYVFLSSD